MSEKETIWKIVYQSYEGMQKKAVALLSREIGRYVTRDPGVYTLHVLPCEKEGAMADKNAVFIGEYAKSPVLRQYIAEDEVKKDGYVVKVMENPQNPAYRYVLIAGDTDSAVFYGAVDFIDVYCPMWGEPLPADPIKNPFDLFTLPLTLRTLSGFPKTENRKVFTWGHPINDYRQYVENLARVKINEVIVWNDFCPLNAEEMVEYAHSYGIKVVFGYAWGWIAGCSNITDISEKRLAEIQAEAVKKFETEYAPLHADGIYFQSFTERGDRFIGGRNIAEAVTALVNGTVRELLDKYPSLQIEFGLHRQSVAEDLEEIAKVDPRVEIVWENGDCFPMCSEPDCADETLWEKEVSVLKKLIHLRNNGKTSFLYKGFATLDWNGNRFVYQRGPYIMGDSRPDLQGEDTLLRRNRWRYLSGQWAEKGDFAQRMTRFIQKESKGNAGLGMAALLDDGVWLPELLAANMIYNADEDFTFNLRKSLTSPCVEW